MGVVLLGYYSTWFQGFLQPSRLSWKCEGHLIGSENGHPKPGAVQFRVVDRTLYSSIVHLTNHPNWLVAVRHTRVCLRSRQGIPDD